VQVIGEWGVDNMVAGRSSVRASREHGDRKVLFTFILEYRGGTYVSQIRADCIDDAIPIWVQSLPVDEIKHFGPKLKKRLVEGLASDKNGIYGATQLEGVTNVWYVSIPFSARIACINAVKTDVS
jgi:hypothetical protein